MTNNEYFEKLNIVNGNLKSFRKEYLNLARSIVGETLLKEDLFFCASLDKGIRVLDGFISMINERNLTCVGVLVRMQIDNCFRTYAPFIAKNKEEVIDTIIYSKKELRQCLTNKDKKMRDSVLLEELSVFDGAIIDVYKQASGYVHLSEKAFYAIARTADSSLLTLNIGGELDERCNDAIVEGVSAFSYFTKLQQKILREVAESKERFDKTYRE